MLRGFQRFSDIAIIGFFAAAAWILPACGGTGHGGAGGMTGSGGSNGGTGGMGNGGTGGSGPGTGGSVSGTGGSNVAPPPAPKCAGGVDNAAATAIDFSNNVLASPSPPGSLTVATAPQIVVFGWDDVESTEGITFVNSLYGTLMNPDGTKSHCNLNPNACYGEGGAPPPGKYTCGNGTLSLTKDMVTLPSFDLGNHTIDHLEGYEVLGGWSGIPAAWKDTMNGGWKFMGDKGPGLFIDQTIWTSVITANDMELKSLYGVGKTLTISGFRAPRLEINDAGLLAMKAFGYTYDQDLEEILPEGYADAAIAVDTPGKKGFNWVPWPYTLDNGSPGIWNQQADDANITYMVNYPTGLMEIPVYMLYVPSANGLGKAIADSMLKSDAPTNCTFPAGTPADQMKHCYLAEGELSPGDSVKEVTAFDFNTFIYSRMTVDQWLAVMKHTFLMRYYGNRAPLTYGAHPVEYTEPYDSYTLMVQGNNYGYRDVLKYTTYATRQAAMKMFIDWIKTDATLSKDTYFMSAAQLAAFMKAPFDKTGAKAMAETVATPDSNGVFKRLTWVTRGSATIAPVDGNTADIGFTVATAAVAPVSVVAGVVAGSLKNLSHIDLKYTSDVPFRVRLFSSDGSSMTALLAGVGSERTARIRVKDFSPGPEASAAQVGAAGLVGGDFMAKVNGIAFESAATAVTGGKAFKTHIEQLTLHGADTAALCPQ